MRMPLAEIVDRYTISLLKSCRLPDASEQEYFARQALDIGQFVWGAAYPSELMREAVSDLMDINGEIWDAEAGIRAATIEEGGLTPEKLQLIGTLALKVRDLNRKRCAIKNGIVEATGDGWRECKVNYGSGS